VRHLVGVDVGGTFTDVLLMPLDGSRSVLAKVPSTADPAEGVVQGVLEAARRATVDPDDVELIRLRARGRRGRVALFDFGPRPARYATTLEIREIEPLGAALAVEPRSIDVGLLDSRV
jgi:N-methylhydantoinase A